MFGMKYEGPQSRFVTLRQCQASGDHLGGVDTTYSFVVQPHHVSATNSRSPVMNETSPNYSNRRTEDITRITVNSCSSSTSENTSCSYRVWPYIRNQAQYTVFTAYYDSTSSDLDPMYAIANFASAVEQSFVNQLLLPTSIDTIGIYSNNFLCYFLRLVETLRNIGGLKGLCGVPWLLSIPAVEF